MAPGRIFSCVCFERVTSFSTYLPEPGRNAVAKLGIEDFALARRFGSRVHSGRIPSGFNGSMGGKFETWGGQNAGAFC